MFTERLSENPNAATLRSVNYEKLKGLTKADHPEAGHYNFLALCNGEDFQVIRKIIHLGFNCIVFTNRVGVL